MADMYSHQGEPLNKIMLPQENLVERSPSLELDIPDGELNKYISKRIKQSEDYFKMNREIPMKQDRNKDYRMGKQWDQRELQKYNQNPFMDNIFYEAEKTIKAVALSKVPDLIIKPGNNTELAKRDAQDLTKIFQDEQGKRPMRKVLSTAFEHIPVYYLGAIMPIWDVERGAHGDYDFPLLHPKYLIIDPTANSLDTTKHKFLGHFQPIQLDELVMRFPKKEKEIVTEFGLARTPQGSEWASTVKIVQLYFDWYKKQGDEWEKITAVAWKYKRILLGKMRDPNWDWEGEIRTFVYDQAKQKKEEASEGDLRSILLHATEDRTPDLGQMPDSNSAFEKAFKEFQASRDKVYYNYFESPRKPYILLGYDQWGEMVYDETSRIEQGITLQDNINERGRQITEMAARSRGKDIFSLASGLKKKDIENLDFRNPNTDLLVKGNPRDVHEHIQGEQPDAALFQDKQINTNRLFAQLGTNATTRGATEKQTSKSAKQSQILQQNDYGRIDDMVEETINFGVEQIIEWKMQFIKLRYTVDHFKSILGPEGETTFYRVNRDMITNNNEVVVTASAVDKLMRKQEAYEQLKLKATDPVSFYEALDEPNPKLKAERLYYWMKNQDMYYRKFVKGDTTISDTVSALGQQPGSAVAAPQLQNGASASGDGGFGAAMMALQLIEENEEAPVPQQPDPEYVKTIERFIRSSVFDELEEPIKQRIKAFAMKVLQAALSKGQKPTAQSPAIGAGASLGQGGVPPANPIPPQPGVV